MVPECCLKKGMFLLIPGQTMEILSGLTHQVHRGQTMEIPSGLIHLSHGQMEVEVVQINKSVIAPIQIFNSHKLSPNVVVERYTVIL